MSAEERALRLAVETMWSYPQVLWLLEHRPAMTDEEVQICLEVAQGLHQQAMFETLGKTLAVFTKLEGDTVEYGNRAVRLAEC